MEENQLKDQDEIQKLLQMYCQNRVTITPDHMCAMIELVEPENGKAYTKEDILDLLQESGVTSGILESEVERIVEQKVYYEKVEVAFGVPAEDGKDGEYIYHFNTSPRSAPKILEDGSVDYRNLECFATVTKDQLIVEYKPETKGTDGYDVLGNVLRAKPGRARPTIRGKHIVRGEDKKTYYSDIDGKIELDKDTGKITISEVCVVPEDVDASTGNIIFKGDVEIFGNVLSGFKVEATGNVTVNGIVEAATIKSEKNVILRKGMHGNGRGFVIADGNVEGQFFEQANIQCKGYLHANSIMHCYVDCMDEVVLSGRKGVLLAGRLRALKGVKAVNIGNSAQIPTYIKVGLEPKMKHRLDEIRRKMGELIREIQKITQTQDILNQQSEIPPEWEDTKRQLLRQKITMTTELDHLRNESEELDRQIEVGKRAAVIVEQCAYVGSSVTINGATNSLKDDIEGVVFSLRKGNVVMTYND